MVFVWYLSLILVGVFQFAGVRSGWPWPLLFGVQIAWMALSVVLFRCGRCGLPSLLGYEKGSAIPYFPRLPAETCARCGADL